MPQLKSARNLENAGRRPSMRRRTGSAPIAPERSRTRRGGRDEQRLPRRNDQGNDDAQRAARQLARTGGATRSRGTANCIHLASDAMRALCTGTSATTSACRAWAVGVGGAARPSRTASGGGPASRSGRARGVNTRTCYANFRERGVNRLRAPLGQALVRCDRTGGIGTADDQDGLGTGELASGDAQSR